MKDMAEALNNDNRERSAGVGGVENMDILYQWLLCIALNNMYYIL